MKKSIIDYSLYPYKEMPLQFFFFKSPYIFSCRKTVKKCNNETSSNKNNLEKYIKNESENKEFVEERSEGKVEKIDILGKLPIEISQYVLEYLIWNIEQLDAISRVSKIWRNIADSPSLWMRAFVNRCGNHISKEKLEKLYTQDTDWRNLTLKIFELDLKWASGRAKVNFVCDKESCGQNRAHSGPIYCVKCSEHYIVSGSRDKTIKIWNIKSLECIKTIRYHKGSVLCLDFNDHYLVTGSSDEKMVIWSFPSGELKTVMREHNGPVLNVKLCKYGVVSCSKNGDMILWDIELGIATHIFVGHECAINSLYADGDMLVSGSGDRTVKIWSLSTGDLIGVLKYHLRGVSVVALHNNIVFSGSGDSTVKVWDTETGKCKQTLYGHSDIVRALSIDNIHVVTGSYDKSICIWDVNSGELLKKIENAHDDYVYNIHSNYDKIVSAGKDGTIKVWDFAHGLGLDNIF